MCQNRQSPQGSALEAIRATILGMSDDSTTPSDTPPTPPLEPVPAAEVLSPVMEPTVLPEVPAEAEPPAAIEMAEPAATSAVQEAHVAEEPSPSQEMVAAEPSPIQPAESPAPSAPPSQPTRIESSPSHGHALTQGEGTRGRARQKANIEVRLEKILAFARTEASKNESITNDMVEKLLHVSGATATRYLNMLVLRGKLRREGRTRGVRYLVI